MANACKVLKTAFGSVSSMYIAPWKEFFDNFNCPLITTTIPSTGHLTVMMNDDTVGFQINCENEGSSGWVGAYSVLVDGTVTSRRARMRGPVYTTVCCNNNIFYVQMCNNPSGSGVRYIYCYEFVDNKRYFGYYGSNTGSVAFQDITTLSFTNTASNASYTHNKLLTYTVADLNAIDYLSEDQMMTGSTILFSNPNYVPCTSVAADQVLTFNGHNYYAVGTNTLVLLED